MIMIGPDRHKYTAWPKFKQPHPGESNFKEVLGKSVGWDGGG